eukprot:g27530.t1
MQSELQKQSTAQYPRLAPSFFCEGEKSESERFLPHRCSVTPESLCCRACFVAWVQSQIDADSPNIRCCHCEEELSTGTLQRLVDEEHFQRYCEAAVQRSLKRDQQFIWCSQCTGGGWVDTRYLSSCGWSCPECSNNFVYCPLCRRMGDEEKIGKGALV